MAFIFTLTIAIVILIVCLVTMSRLGEVNSTLYDLKLKVDKLSAEKVGASAPAKVLISSAEEERPKPVAEEPVAQPVAQPVAPPVAQPIAQPVEQVVEQPQPQTEPAPAPIVDQPKFVASTPPKEPKKRDYEKYIGENLFGKIGILVLVVGIGLFLKYANDNEWLNETMRTVLGFVTGSILLFIGHRLSKQYRMFSSLLTGGAFATFYIIIAVAYHYYELFSQPVAFALLIVVTILMVALSLLYNRRELAIISLVGGFIAPFLVSSGNDSYLALFSYMAILNISMFVLALRKKWGELTLICFGGTYIAMTSFIIVESDISSIALPLLAFSTLYYLIFLLPLIYILRSCDKINRVLLSMVVSNNFIYMTFGLYLLGQIQSGITLNGVLTLFVAAVNLLMVLWLMRYHKQRKELVYSMLGLVLSFVSLTIPLQLDGNYVTLFWATEMVILLWLFVKSRMVIYNYFGLAMIGLTTISFLMDLFSYGSGDSIIFVNADFATSLFISAAYIVVALLIHRYRTVFDSEGVIRYNPFNLILLAVGVLFTYISCVIEFSNHIADSVSGSTIDLFSILYILLVAILAKKRFGIGVLQTIYYVSLGLALVFFISNSSNYNVNVMFWLGWAAMVAVMIFTALKMLSISDMSKDRYNWFMVSLNAVVVVVGTVTMSTFLRQIGVGQQSAGFSIILAAIGTTQMILGMRYHIRVLRIISVVLLGVVMAKLLLFDLWGMNLVGKIVVFISLGVILLALSFLYQKLKNVLFSQDQDGETK